MDSHVNEQFVAGVEGSVAARATGPETSEVLRAPLVHVTPFDVAHQFILTVENPCFQSPPPNNVITFKLLTINH